MSRGSVGEPNLGEVFSVDLMKLPDVAVRWWYVFALIVGAAVIGLAIQLVVSPPAYEATVAIQISAPTADNVQLLGSGSNSSSSLRDNLLLVSNDFTFVAKSSEVRNLTIQRLSLTGSDANFTMSIKPVSDSSYLNLTVQARTSQLARAIATTQAQEAIQYYGELRSKPATTTVDLLNNQLQATAATITSLQSSGTSQNGPSSTSLALQQAMSNYQTLLQKRSDALLAAQDAAHVSYIQIVDSAPTATAPSWVKSVGVSVALTLIGSLGLALLAAFVLESLYPTKGMGPVRLPNRVTDLASRGDAELSGIARAPESGDNFRGNALRSRESN